MAALNPWIHGRLPRGPAAALAALHLSDPRPPDLSDAEWKEALDFCDRAHLTLLLRDAARDVMPCSVRDRTDRNAEQNRQRVRAAEELYRSLHSRLSGNGIEFLAMKGLAQCPDFVARTESRVQYDVDLFVPADHLTAARDAILAMGYESFDEMERFPTDHLPPLIRKTGWEWRGDFFDPEIPYSIEIHYRFWNPDLERLAVEDVDAFWTRRVARQLAGVRCDVLLRPDALGYSCLHVLKHILRGSVKPFHVYELANFLHSHAADDAFWSQWRSLHRDAFRRLQAVAFRLAESWFGCDAGDIAREEMERLPRATADWFAKSSAAPPCNPFITAKDELGLHLTLLQLRRDAWPIVRRRLFPARLPGAVDAVHIQDDELSLSRRIRKQARYAAYLASRIRRHAVAFPRAAATCLAWWWRAGGRE